jgi:hypothetical protein
MFVERQSLRNVRFAQKSRTTSRPTCRPDGIACARSRGSVTPSFCASNYIVILPDGQISEFAVKPHLRKYSSCRVGQNHRYLLARLTRTRGGSRSSRNARWDAMDAAASARRRWLQGGSPVSDRSARRRTAPKPAMPFGEDGLLRTAKSCGPGIRC